MMTRDDIISIAREADCTHVNVDGDRAMAAERLTRFAAIVATAEREACAQIASEMEGFAGDDVAAAIRNRSTP